MASPGFYLDIISVFPAYIFLDTLDPQGQSMTGPVAELLPILQVWHLWDYIGKWEKNFDSNLKVSKLTTSYYTFCLYIVRTNKFQLLI